MKKITFKNLFTVVLIITLGSFVSSCKKNPANGSGNTQPVDSTHKQLSDADSLKYFMYRTMKVSFVDGGRDSSYDLPSYYWYSSVPKLDPLSSSYDSAAVLLAKMKTYAINPTSGRPFDKYSFLDQGQVAGEIVQGVAGDIGMQVAYAGDGTAQNTSLFVLFADKNSPAGQAGAARGDQITAVNGSQVTYDGSNGANVNSVINAVYNDASASFTFKRPNGSSFTATLSKTVYNIDPVQFDSVYTIGAKKVGYFVFNSFASVDNQNGPTFTRQELLRVFNEFQSAGISDLIVDLRYNGGGSVSTAEFMDSLIAPASVAGKVMYSYLYNDKLTAMASQIGLQSNVMFGGGGSLNLGHVFFIGSPHTASASELTINNLKPYMDVKLVGDTTYGKPVGFFTFHLTDFPNGGATEKFLADLYAINFETRNANNVGGYFDGLIPDQVAKDFVDVPWGNPNDDNLAKVFNYISTGTYGRLTTQERMAQNSLRLLIPSTIHPLRFNGMVDYRISKEISNAINKNLRKAH